MATATTRASAGDLGDPNRLRLRVYLWLCSGVSLLLVGAVVARGWDSVTASPSVILVWAIVAAIADLFAVRLFRSITLSMSFVVTLSAAMALAPAQAAMVAFIGSLDRRELRREVSVPQSLFNRSQIACSTAAAALVFAASPAELEDWPQLLLWSMLALSADFVVNLLFMVPAIAIRDGIGLRQAIRVPFGSVPSQTLFLYVFLGCLAPIVAVAYQVAGGWGLAASLLPIWLARESLEKTEDLKLASLRLSTKDEALREVEDQVVEERRDERLTLAGDLHDEVIPALYRVHLMGEVLRQDLSTGQLLQLEEDLPVLLDATSHAQRTVRRLVGSLRTSPIGSGGLGRALDLLSRQLDASGAPLIRLDVGEVKGSERAKLVIFQVAREALTNAAKYSQSSEIRARVWSDDGLLRVSVADDGVGFELERVMTAPSHYGLLMMRERVEAVGGALVIDSRLGAGVTITASVPPDA
jgi:signal transduction histidine kinase